MCSASIQYQMFSKYLNRIKVSHNELSIMRNYEYDSWNKIENGQVKLNTYYKNERIAFVSFRSFTGQIGLIDVDEKYRRQGIAISMLKLVEKDMMQNSVNKIWAICSFGHYFWSVQTGYTFEDRPHNSVTGSGYSKQL